MSIYAISDLHLSFGSDKPMNIFRGWDNHTEKLKANWNRLVKEEDTVILPGDFSWGLKLNETLPDFKFLESLNGKKIILKGNHDLWWSTVKKLKEFLNQNEIHSVDILFNNTIITEGHAIAGTRGWFYDDKADKKIIAREVGRLEKSLTEAEKTGLPILCFLHYPPVYNGEVCEEIFAVIKNHNIKKVYHGHIHGAGLNNATKEYEGVEFKLISCDCVDFTPVFIF
ncbi:MAG: metallophosphoesterase [Clostridia bacterium]|nr:metallophosphoesterase [Clostridia bacterium]